TGTPYISPMLASLSGWPLTMPCRTARDRVCANAGNTAFRAMCPRPTTAKRTGFISAYDHAPVMSLWQDLRHGARVFARNPALTAIAITSIAFGTGANVAIFSVADALLLKPMPVLRPSEMLTVGSMEKHGVVDRSLASFRDYLDIRDRTTT